MKFNWLSPVITKIANRKGYWNVKVTKNGVSWFTQLKRYPFFNYLIHRK